MPGTGQPQSKRFCFTINNPSAVELASITGLVPGSCIRFIAGEEVGENGTPHIQGYIEVEKKTRFNGLRSKFEFLHRAHIEVAKGTRKQNFEYCRKDGKVIYQIGEAESERTGRLDIMCTSIMAGKRLAEVSAEDPATFVRNYRGLQHFRNLQYENKERRTDLRVIVYFGEPGTGKTRKVYDENTELWSWPGGNWFDGYAGESVVLFDDFAGQLEFRWLLRLLDIYPLQVPIKGGFVPWSPRIIYITTNRHPSTWYPEEDMAPLRRRLTSVVEFSEPDVAVCDDGV